MPVYIIKGNLKSYSSSKHTEISHNHNIAKKKKSDAHNDIPKVLQKYKLNW